MTRRDEIPNYDPIIFAQSLLAHGEMSDDVHLCFLVEAWVVVFLDVDHAVEYLFPIRPEPRAGIVLY